MDFKVINKGLNSHIPYYTKLGQKCFIKFIPILVILFVYLYGLQGNENSNEAQKPELGISDVSRSVKEVSYDDIEKLTGFPPGSLQGKKNPRLLDEDFGRV